MDFKIGDEIEDTTDENYKPKGNSKLPLIIVIVVSLLFGLTVFLISNALFGGKKGTTEEPVVDQQVQLTDENVQILYDYVTYGTRNHRNDKFLKEQSVTLSSFSNQERFYYALQFAQPEDFEYTKKLDDQKHKIYTISNDKIKGYMQRFFGNQVTYSTSSDIKYTFTFKINNKNVGELKYSVDNDGFDTVFTDLEEDIPEELVEPYYTDLVSATKKLADNSLSLVENVIYTDVQKENDVYTVNIYKDYQHTMLIETKQNLTEAQLKENPINISDYNGKTATVTYLFKVNNNSYYFDSSKINN